jgi:hypothetical protein
MPRLIGPLFSLDARKTLGGTVVYSAWKDLNYARLRVIPYNPKSAYQSGIRDTIRWGVLYFTKGSYVEAAQKTWWNTYAEGTSMSGWNRFLSKFVDSNYDKDTGTFIYAGIPDPS